MSLTIQLLTIRPVRRETSPIAEATATYLQRCRDVATETRFRTEEALLQSVDRSRRAGAASFWIADGSGKQLTSIQFAQQVGQARDAGRRQLLLAIGPADGWSEAARAQADLRLSLGPMTLPHELAALVLAEQIYRASTILQGHPYHLGH